MRLSDPFLFFNLAASGLKLLYRSGPVRGAVRRLTGERKTSSGFYEAPEPFQFDRRATSKPGQSFQMRNRLSPENSAGGGLVVGPDGQQRPHYWGHRERLRTRFLAGGAESMPDYEILEMLLFNAIPRVDTKPCAKRLLKTFGDLHGVFGASKSRILEVEGTNEKVFFQLRLAETMAERLALKRVRERLAISSHEDVVEYCRTVMAHRETEQFRVLFLDRRNALIQDELMSRGTVSHVSVHPREVIQRALELNASAVILIHNHPSGDPSPSDPDITMTERIELGCESVGISLHDHLIVGAKNEVSFRQMGLLAPALA